MLRPPQLGELDAHRAAVIRVAPPNHEPLLLEPVEVPRERGALYPKRLRELVLRPPRLALEIGEDEPHRHRPADLGQGVIEGASDVLRRVSELEADWGAG